ncbi:MAG: Nif3-like dinuclear metal center hexameric protein [Candidatus Nanopelagicales bacterium]|nr:Nif3-like dinuclear metal center hexameric protein [Candidatus Nanopelagicales bacterium]
MSATVAQVNAALERRYAPDLAADWDAVGLVCGDPTAVVERVLLAVDPVQVVVDEAIIGGYDMVITHHPLFLHGVSSVAATDAKGKVVHALIANGIALACAHTNADHANPGVSDALGRALGVRDLQPLDVLRGDTGTGRVGELLEPVTLGEFADAVAALLPATHHGVRVAGDLAQVVRRVAVCGGSGDSLLALAAAAADVYVTSDLRHHRAQDHRADGGCALVDVAHWASEWPWLEVAAATLVDDLAGAGLAISADCSSTPTDPWTAHRPSATLGRFLDEG